MTGSRFPFSVQAMDVYVEIQRATGLSAVACGNLRKRNTFHPAAFTRSSAMATITKHVADYSLDVVDQLLVRMPEEYPEALLRLEARAATLLSSLNISVDEFRALCILEPFLIGCPPQRFGSVVTLLSSLLPSPPARGALLRAFPELFEGMDIARALQATACGAVDRWRETEQASRLLKDPIPDAQQFQGCLTVLWSLIRTPPPPTPSHPVHRGASATHPLPSADVPPATSAAPIETIADAFAVANWIPKDAARHLDAFPFVAHVPPSTLANSLIQLAELGLSGHRLTRRLTRMVQRMHAHHERLWGEHPLAVGWGDSIALSIHRLADFPLDPVLATTGTHRMNAMRQAIVCLASLHHCSPAMNKAEYNLVLSEASRLIRMYPEWLAYGCQPLHLATELRTRWDPHPQVMRANLSKPWAPSLLLEPAEAVALAITKFRRLATSHVASREDAGLFDPLLDWRRLCLPYGELLKRWDFLERISLRLLRPMRETAFALYLPRRQAFCAMVTMIAERTADEGSHEEENVDALTEESPE